jgi:hypothetical protein
MANKACFFSLRLIFLVLPIVSTRVFFYNQGYFYKEDWISVTKFGTPANSKLTI